MNEVFMNSEDMQWENSPSYPPETKIKILREEGSAKTFF